jgi:hypothetical protein
MDLGQLRAKPHVLTPRGGFVLVSTQQIQAGFDNSIETNETPIGGGP